LNLGANSLFLSGLNITANATGGNTNNLRISGSGVGSVIIGNGSTSATSGALVLPASQNNLPATPALVFADTNVATNVINNTYGGMYYNNGVSVTHLNASSGKFYFYWHNI
jgi:hypothetical protein